MKPVVYQEPISRWQQAKNFAKDTFGNSKAKAVMVATPVIASANMAYANTALPELTIDVASLMKAFAVIIAAIATVGMGVLTVALMAKAFKYIRGAF